MQRGALTFGQGFPAASEQNLSLFKHLARRAANRSRSFHISTVFYQGFSITRIKLATGERMKAAEERQLFTAFHEKDFRIVWIGVRAEENYGCRVFWSRCSVHS